MPKPDVPPQSPPPIPFTTEPQKLCPPTTKQNFAIDQDKKVTLFWRISSFPTNFSSKLFSFSLDLLGPRFAAASDGSIRVVVNSQIIPEPEEYALIFALFALSFVLFHRHWQKKQHRQPAATTS